MVGANLISVVACDTSGNTSQQQISVTYTPTALQAWRQTYFGSPDNTGDGADLNEFDHDGIVNLLEFALLLCWGGGEGCGLALGGGGQIAGREGVDDQI